MSKWLKIAGFTLLHLVVTAIAIANSFTLGMGRFDTGAPMTLREHVWGTVGDLLSCPLYPLTRSLHLGLLSNLVFFLNSLLWGVALYWLSMRLFRRKQAA